MADLKTNYMGLELKNPVIVGASNLVTNPQNLKKLEEAGAAAVVYKSLFEEQIQLENLELYERTTEYEDRHAEMVTLFPRIERENKGPIDYLMNIKKAKNSVSIPVFASINAINDATWVDYAVRAAETGVDGLELNFYSVPEKPDGKHADIETRQLETFRKVRSAVSIPIAVKLSSFYTNPLKIIYELDKAGANGVVLFNRLFQPDIDIENEQHRYPFSLSNAEDNRLPLRFSGLLYGNTKASVCANTGIFNGHDVVKMLLAGADAVEVVSTLYLNQISVIGTILNDLSKWMDSKGYETIGQFRGKLSSKATTDPNAYYRAQYFDFQMSTSAILKKYKAIN